VKRHTPDQHGFRSNPEAGEFGGTLEKIVSLDPNIMIAPLLRLIVGKGLKAFKTSLEETTFYPHHADFCRCPSCRFSSMNIWTFWQFGHIDSPFFGTIKSSIPRQIW